ncbi:MAG: glycosyltransferase [Gammaproteobacteria bacterium]
MPVLSTRKQRILDLANKLADKRDLWIGKNNYYYQEDYKFMRFLIPEESHVLDLGCGTGRLLSELKPSIGVGVDFSPSMINVARNKYPHLSFHVADIESPEELAFINEEFDYIILSDTIGSLEDCQKTLSLLHRFCNSETRIVVAYFDQLWRPALRMAELLGAKMPQERQNWLGTEDIVNILRLAEFEKVKREWRQLIPRKLFGLGTLINRYVAPFPGIRRLCLRNYVVARSLRKVNDKELSVSIIIPAKNEKGNIEPAVLRLPKFGSRQEILFVEGHSQDGTLEEIYRVKNNYPEHDIRIVVQDGKGKGDAVRMGFSNASGEVLMILDADLTMPPEDLSKFYDVIVSGMGEFVNGSRLVYPMEEGAMRFLNHIANQFFSLMFSWLLNQRFTDTLCGTKVVSMKNYKNIAANRQYFGSFDPFGDFDLIFGAAKLNLKVVEIPIRYASRMYGETQISRFRHGWLLLKMVLFAFRKLKALA